MPENPSEDAGPGANISSLLDAEITHDYAIPTCHEVLNTLLDGGMRGGDFIVVAGLPGIGSSTFALGLARSTAITHGYGAYVACLQANAGATAQRVVAAESAVPLHHIRTGELDDRDRARLAEHAGRIRTAPLRLTDHRRDLAAIREDAFAFGDAAGSLRLVLIDGAHLLIPSHDYGGRAQFADDFARDMKELAVLHNLVVVTTVPLEFPYADRGAHRPLLRDFGKRQSFASAADVVILIHREDYFDRESSRAGEADIVVAKNSGGRTELFQRDRHGDWNTQVPLTAFQRHYARFMDMALG